MFMTSEKEPYHNNPVHWGFLCAVCNKGPCGDNNLFVKKRSVLRSDCFPRVPQKELYLNDERDSCVRGPDYDDTLRYRSSKLLWQMRALTTQVRHILDQPELDRADMKVAVYSLQRSPRIYIECYIRCFEVNWQRCWLTIACMKYWRRPRRHRNWSMRYASRLVLQR